MDPRDAYLAEYYNFKRSEKVIKLANQLTRLLKKEFPVLPKRETWRDKQLRPDYDTCSALAALEEQIPCVRDSGQVIDDRNRRCEPFGKSYDY